MKAHDKPRIALCITVYEHGGQRVVINEQTKRLANRYTFDLFTEDQQIEAPPWLTVHEISPWRSRLNPVPTKRFQKAIANYDLVHSHDSFAYIYESAKTKLPLVVTSHGNCPAHYRDSLRLKFEYYISEPLYGIAYSRADKVITISSYLQQWLHQRYAIEAVLCPNGVDNDRFKPRQIARHNSFFYVGHISARKGIPTLIKSFNSFRRTNPSFELRLAGFGEMVDEVKSMEKDNIKYLGFITDEQLSEEYSSCLAFVTPSYWEGFGLPILEAMGTGTYVIARNAYAMPELITDTALGLLFNDDDSLESALHQATRQRYTLTEGPIVAGQYTWSASAAKVANVYNSLIGNKCYE